MCVCVDIYISGFSPGPRSVAGRYAAFDARYAEIFTDTLKRCTCVAGKKLFRLKVRLSHFRHKVTCASQAYRRVSS